VAIPLTGFTWLIRSSGSSPSAVKSCAAPLSPAAQALHGLLRRGNDRSDGGHGRRF
jgi:hypothetical protein